MALHSPEQFVEEIAEWYAKHLKERLPEATFKMDENDAVEQALRNPRLFRIVKDFDHTQSKFYMDDYLREGGNIAGDLLIDSVGEALLTKVQEVADPELKQEREDRLKKIGAGDLWIIHKPIPAIKSPGVFVHFAQKAGVGVFGRGWQDGGRTIFEVRTSWAVARHGEVQKESISI